MDIQHASIEANLPSAGDICHWVSAALKERRNGLDTELTVRIVDSDEMSTLNKQFRNKSGPTNVLSFPADLPPELGLPLLGDIIICAPVVVSEAQEQGKTIRAHWAHMSVHGTLHLLGYDHIKDNEAAAMEALETRILNTLDFPCPYEATDKEHQVQ
ncbi:MAG: rRNA maturation RNase YbeY [Parahaliea sp.]